MKIIYKGCLCRYGTCRVLGEDKPVFYLIEAPKDVDLFAAGFVEMSFAGPWCHYLEDEEIAKMNAFIEEQSKKGEVD